MLFYEKRHASSANGMKIVSTQPSQSLNDKSKKDCKMPIKSLSDKPKKEHFQVKHDLASNHSQASLKNGAKFTSSNHPFPRPFKNNQPWSVKHVESKPNQSFAPPIRSTIQPWHYQGHDQSMYFTSKKHGRPDDWNQSYDKGKVKKQKRLHHQRN